MDSTARRSGGGILEGLYRVIMRRNSVYVTFIVAGAFVGERVDAYKGSSLIDEVVFWLQMVDYGIHKLWEYNNVGDNRGALAGSPLHLDYENMLVEDPKSTMHVKEITKTEVHLAYLSGLRTFQYWDQGLLKNELSDLLSLTKFHNLGVELIVGISERNLD
ncbi:hypothetical protein HHK36_011391 [Tetracentron sinense]|uniref:Uncharacterized protein n=1 Tax=Tetracentron sinense TaxID=13715 RepID=A0A834Z956_TETSI|nr:hypothetical protein HHK36_011391 [Tetracentron sinense]